MNITKSKLALLLEDAKPHHLNIQGYFFEPGRNIEHILYYQTPNVSKTYYIYSTVTSGVSITDIEATAEPHVGANMERVRNAFLDGIRKAYEQSEV